MTSPPSAALEPLPDTGASTNTTPCRAARSARRSHDSTPTVLIWIHIVPGESMDSAPVGPAVTCSTAAPSVSMVISTSAARRGFRRCACRARAVGGQHRGLGHGPIPDSHFESCPQQVAHLGADRPGAQHGDS